MAKIIDEELLKTIASRKNPRGSVLELSEEELKEQVKANYDFSQEEDIVSVKGYESVFFREEVIRDRVYLYVGKMTKKRLETILRRMGWSEISLMNYVDNILNHHIDQYKEEINKIYRKKGSKNIL